MITNTAICKTV